MEEENVNLQMDAISDAIEIASPFQLEIEVILWSMKALKENPELTIKEAIDIGLDEWIK